MENKNLKNKYSALKRQNRKNVIRYQENIYYSKVGNGKKFDTLLGVEDTKIFFPKH